MARERSQTVTASYDFAEDINIQGNYVWNTGTLAWEKQTSAGGGGGGGPVTIADGADTVEGTLADAAIVTDANGTVSGKLRGLVKMIASVWDSVNGRLKVDGSAVTQPVSGTFWQATQPVSGTFWQATQPVSVAATLNADVTDRALRDCGKVDVASLDQYTPVSGRLPVDGSGVTQPISAASLPLPAGAATEATLLRINTQGQKAMSASTPVVLPSDQSAIPINGDVDHDAVNTLKNIQMAGHASPSDIPPAVVSANGDRARIWVDRSGAQIVRPRRLRESYTAVCRLAEAAGRLDQSFTQVANTNKQWATLHHTAGATKEVRLRQCVCYITAWSVATQGILELRQISAAPATGNPAITPTPHRRGGTAAEAVVLYLPTTAGTEAGVNSPLGHRVFDYGIMGAVSTVNPMPLVNPIVLYDASLEADEVLPPTLPVATLDGWAVMLRTVGAPVVRMTVVFKFTEEIP